MKHSKAFTLLELMVVIFIMSLVTAMVFSTLKRKEKKVKVLDPTTLPAEFRKAFKGQGDVELFCINKCQECYVMKEGALSPYEGEINLGKEVEVHLLDDDNRFVQIDDFGRIKDKKVCLRYHLYANGSTTQMVLKNSKGIYYLPSFFGKAQKVAEMDEAKEFWIKEDYDLKDSGSFY
jgi:prepilin-type N-terminal cleavage/methylation domain-containing protein